MRKDIVLEQGQIDAVKAIRKWYNRGDTTKEFFVLSGCAGSGKSTLIEYFIQDIGLMDREIQRMAPTGKASQRLQELGHENAQTIHSTIYHVTVVEKEDGTEQLIMSLRDREKLEMTRLFVVDEASMIDETLKADILSYGIPTLFIGDHNQLPPVKGVNSIMKTPDVRLEKPVRQAEGNSIIALSQHILKYGTYGLKKTSFFGADVDIITQLPTENLKDFDQILVGKHATRKRINDFMRVNVDSIAPLKGDKIICKKNNWTRSIETGGMNIFLTNGLIGHAVEDVDIYMGNIVFSPEISRDGEVFETKFDFDYLNTGRFLIQNKDVDKFDYGYAVTVHSFQGSEKDNILVINEPIGRTTIQRKQWLYTAVTRAVKKLTIYM